MSDDADPIAVDHEVLGRSAAVLRRAADGLASVAADIAGAPLSGTAFGAMNSWMIPPISSVAGNSVELLRMTGNVVEVLAAATDDAADDFATTEADVQAWVKQMDELLDAGMAPVPPPAPAIDSTPAPQPSPSPGPTPTPPAEDSTP